LIVINIGKYKYWIDIIEMIFENIYDKKYLKGEK
jgi:hypothetical protein